MLILEDDPYRELYFEDSASEADVRPIRAETRRARDLPEQLFEDAGARLFAWPGLTRRRRWRQSSKYAKQAEDLCTGELDQRVVFEACRRGILARQLPMLRAHYQQKRNVMVDALSKSFGGDVTWPEPRGGFFLWATLPAPLDAETPDRAGGRARGRSTSPGDAFFVERIEPLRPITARARARPGSSVIRLSFSAPAPARIQEGVARLKTAIDEEIAAVTGAGRYRSPHREAR